MVSGAVEKMLEFRLWMLYFGDVSEPSFSKGRHSAQKDRSQEPFAPVRIDLQNQTTLTFPNLQVPKLCEVFMQMSIFPLRLSITETDFGTNDLSVLILFYFSERHFNLAHWVTGPTTKQLWLPALFTATSFQSDSFVPEKKKNKKRTNAIVTVRALSSLLVFFSFFQSCS